MFNMWSALQGSACKVGPRISRPAGALRGLQGAARPLGRRRVPEIFSHRSRAGGSSLTRTIARPFITWSPLRWSSIHKIKHDDYRMMAWRNGERVLVSGSLESIARQVLNISAGSPPTRGRRSAPRRSRSGRCRRRFQLRRSRPPAPPARGCGRD
jgi:hypothetical protein